MEIQNVIYPEEEYRAFGQLFIDLDPIFDEELEDQQVVDAYNEIKNATPEITMDQLKMIVPQIAAQMKQKMGLEELDVEAESGKPDRLDTLKSMGE